MIDGAIAPHLGRLFGLYPFVTVTGPRQSGKTTLCRSAFAHLGYASLEAPHVREFAEADPLSFLEQYRRDPHRSRIEELIARGEAAPASGNIADLLPPRPVLPGPSLSELLPPMPLSSTLTAMWSNPSRTAMTKRDSMPSSVPPRTMSPTRRAKKRGPVTSIAPIARDHAEGAITDNDWPNPPPSRPRTCLLSPDLQSAAL